MSKRWLYLIILLLLSSPLYSQESKEEERLVRLIRADVAEKFENEHYNVRRVSGNAQFIHNGALIICDTAHWDLTANRVDAIGGVTIHQDKTTLTGDYIQYFADSSLAKVRGSIVELLDGDSNRLRTHYLNYNTKDSIGYFYNGGSMLDTSGNVIESKRGYYYAKEERFKFLENVEMSGEEVVLKSDSLEYWSHPNRIDFLGATEAWQEGGYLSANGGWYDRKNEIYLFEGDTYILKEENEIWGDKLLYNATPLIAQLWDNIQIVDTLQQIIIFSDYLKYREEQSQHGASTFAELYKKPSIAYYSVEQEVADTLFFSADTINFWSIANQLVDSSTLVSSQRRYQGSQRDPIKELYSKESPPKMRATKERESQQKEPEQKEPEQKEPEQKEPEEKRDSTYTVSFLDAKGRVKFYRSDFQGVCDSLRFNSIDSAIRLYREPLLWNEESQAQADSIEIFLREKRMRKIDFLSNAFLISSEDSLHHNQIKGSDMSIYFTDGDLSRFDAYGGVTLLFFIREEEILTTMNRKECRAMSAKIRERSAEIIRYMENVPSDAYPLVDLESDQTRLRGFKLWDEVRPKERLEVCDRVAKASLRTEKEALELPQFKYSWIFYKLRPLKK